MSTTRTQVKPATNVEAGQGNVDCLQQGTQKVAPTSLVGATFTAPDTISGTGIDFAAAGVQRNDRVLIPGSTSNDGAWFVKANPTVVGTITVRPLNGGANIVSEAGAGTIEVRVGTHEVLVTDEASPTFANLFSTGTVHASRGSGAIADYRISEVMVTNAGATDVYALLGIGMIRFHQTAAGSSDWISSNELVFDAQIESAGIPVSCSDAAASLSTFQLGTQAGSDLASASEGSAHFAISVQANKSAPYSSTFANLTGKVFGSFMRWDPTFQFAWPPGGATGGSIFYGVPEVPAFGSSGSELDTCTQYGGEAWHVYGASFESTALTVTSSSALAYMPNLGAVTVSGLKITDATSTPMFDVFGTTVCSILDPAGDYTGAEIFFCNATSPGIGLVEYTWNPTFVERDASGVSGSPIQGLKVRIWQINVLGTAEISGSPFTTDAQGQINAGAGQVVLRWVSVRAGIQFDIPTTERIQIEGANYRSQDYIITMRAALDYDHPVDVQQTDFEGEMNVG
jgi:hypothetical protein